MQRKDLEKLSRDELITRAEAAGVARPRSLTTAELLDELVVRGTTQKPEERARARGWFGRAKELLKSALERGLDHPEATPGAARPSRSWPPAPPPPLPTVTLAEIYAAQGHLERAVQVLEEVLAKDPEHAEATRLRGEYRARIDRTVVRGPESPASGTAASTPSAKATATRGAPAAATAGPGASTAAAGAFEGDLAVDEDDTVDEVVAVAVDPTTLYLYWEVRPETAARARVDAPDGALTIRAVTVTAGNDAPISDVRDQRVDALDGELFVRDLADGAHVRVCVGWRSAAGFVPLAVAAEVVTPRRGASVSVATHLAAWSPPAAPAIAPPRRRWVGTPAGALPPPMSTGATTSPGGAPAPPAGGAAPRRTVLLQPAEVFEVPGNGPFPIGVVRPPGSSELVTLWGDRPGDVRVRDARWGLMRGGASDLVLGGASDLALRR